MTVLALGAIILALAVPRFTALLATLRLDDATRRLVRDLHFAQAGAQSRGERYVVRFTEQGYIVLRGTIAVTEVPFPPGVTLEAAVATREIMFTPSGSSSGGFVTLRNDAGTREVLVPTARGHAYVLPNTTR